MCIYGETSFVSNSIFLVSMRGLFFSVTKKTEDDLQDDLILMCKKCLI